MPAETPPTMRAKMRKPSTAHTQPRWTRDRQRADEHHLAPVAVSKRPRYSTEAARPRK
jgi:hypothetical protein